MTEGTALAAPAPPRLDGVAVGCDVVEVERVGGLLRRWPEARDRLFTPEEQADAVRDGVAPDDPAAVRRLAARFAAKEALVKLLGRPALAWTDVEVRTGPDGAPSIHLHGAPTDIAVSLSHDRGVAMAVVARTRPATATVSPAPAPGTPTTTPMPTTATTTTPMPTTATTTTPTSTTATPIR